MVSFFREEQTQWQTGTSSTDKYFHQLSQSSHSQTGKEALEYRRGTGNVNITTKTPVPETVIHYSLGNFTIRSQCSTGNINMSYFSRMLEWGKKKDDNHRF